MRTWILGWKRLRVVVGVAAAIGVVFALEAWTRPPRGLRSPDKSNYEGLPETTPAIVRPKVYSAESARLGPDEPVIGVVAGGRARAYRRAAFERAEHHVVNDLVGDVPLTVTHCDLTRCTRVYAGDGVTPLQMTPGGYQDGMLLRALGRLYRQETGRPADDPDGPPLPYRTIPFEITTWSKWRAAHPDTDAYLTPLPGPITSK